MSYTWPQQNEETRPVLPPTVPAQVPPPPGAWQPPADGFPPPVPPRRGSRRKVVGIVVGVAVAAMLVGGAVGGSAGGSATSATPATPSTSAPTAAPTAAPTSAPTSAPTAADTGSAPPASVDDSSTPSAADQASAWMDAGGMTVLSALETDMDDISSAADAGSYSALYPACQRLVSDAQDGLALPAMPGAAGTSFDSAMNHFVAAGTACQAGDISGATSELGAGSSDIQAATAALPGAGTSS